MTFFCGKRSSQTQLRTCGTTRTERTHSAADEPTQAFFTHSKFSVTPSETMAVCSPDCREKGGRTERSHSMVRGKVGTASWRQLFSDSWNCHVPILSSQARPVCKRSVGWFRKSVLISEGKSMLKTEESCCVVLWKKTPARESAACWSRHI